MKQFQVPQFITVEDKAIGGILTVRQFLFIAGGAGIGILAYFSLPRILFWPTAVFSLASASALAFIKVGERPLTTVVKNMIFYFARPRLYIWQKGAIKKEKTEKKEIQEPKTQIKTIPKLSNSKLSDLAWSLDIKSREKE